MKLSDFDYDLPAELIAQEPLLSRDGSRLMIVNRDTKNITHTQFSKLDEILPENSLLVLNDTKVIPARLIGKKRQTDGKIELLLIEEIRENTWEVLAKPMRSLKIGTQLTFSNDILLAEVIDKPESGNCVIYFKCDRPFHTVLSEIGVMPLPPYIKRPANEDDKKNYQPVYAKNEGAIAAPTAGLHFTKYLFQKLKKKGIETAMLTLHVGIGTFQPVKVQDVETHKMHAEYIKLLEVEAAKIQNARQNGKKIIAIGTTVVRALETAGTTGIVKPFDGKSDLFIYPGYQFNVVDMLVTNFHLPKSTLLMLVSAFAGHSLIQNAYKLAIELKYRFYSYGDAMLIK